ncbi:mechanosensitive ion channel family protein [Paenibacillus tarimensis]|uniref:mechanosensitive ion channel family protein n=1 Tax=Paenibacillus tarimensis TaxID=416012 RepID=UPI001F4834D7|nr:mechanosensitive ion channel family protein [Paenibacillus tarimensis]MCF2944528.1 mechanosensitive ion channel family protein [Paenibacillus tarimensis]
MNEETTINEETISGLWAAIQDWFMNEAMWIAVAIGAIRILLILVIGRVIIWGANKLLNHMILSRNTTRLHIETRRVQTVGRLLKNVVNYVVYFITLLLILSEFNINLGPIIAGAGVVGLAIGFGAQSLVKDVITGFFIILEDQFSVGDFIQTGNFKGTVDVIGLRATRLTSWTGEVYIIPNGSIVEVTNYSLRNSLAVLDVSIAYEEDIDHATEIIKKTIEQVHHENMTKTPEVLGVQALGQSEVTIRVIAECMPNTHFVVARLLNAEIKKSLDANGIEIPYPKMVTYYKGERGGA